jgi:hypothetical protein
MFQCVGMLASAIGPELTEFLHDQLDLMFACKLSEPFYYALIEISANIPTLVGTIQGKFSTLIFVVVNFLAQIVYWLCCRLMRIFLLFNHRSGQDLILQSPT